MATDSPAFAHDLRTARVAQVLAVAWMLVELVVGLGAGVAARSVALTAFAVDSGIEVFTAAVVLHHLVGKDREAVTSDLAPEERRASRLVGYALYLLIAYIAVSAVASVGLRIHPEPSPLGLVLTLAALVVMPVLWRWRLSLSGRLSCPSLRGDAACSVVCIYLAATTLAGIALNQWFGLWWADPVAGLALIWWIRGEANEALEAGRTSA
ncbi:MAG: cation diffusion facilitator family transporter [Candidatus Dormibacteria bacterium]